MRLLRTATWTLASVLLACAVAGGSATARPLASEGKGAEKAAAKPSPHWHRHSLAMPYFSFKPRN